jgi:MerR family copper efflux transcriptional regulator
LIGELACIADVSKRTIDYYTQLGLLTHKRTESNYRLYEENALHDLHLIEHYKKLNMPLAEIKATLEFVREKELDLSKIEKHLDQVSTIMKHLNEEIQEIKPLLESLSDKQKEVLMSKFSSQGVTLANSLLLLLS